ncbi:hypothetical protein AA313_de0206144 [Arthrobotrys entomopaga]|nr:hypothetical protein AA313_de0206144 [Arthrobotrys entomopaga]
MLLSPLSLLLLCIFHAPQFHTQEIPQYESYYIDTLTNWLYINDCITCCYDQQGCGSVTILPKAIGCHLNSCICRKDAVAASATSFLKSCVSEQCQGNVIDISGGVQAYNDYCSRYTVNSIAAAAKSSDGNTSTGSSSFGDNAKPAPSVITETVAVKTTTEVQTSLVTVGKVTSFITQISTVRDVQATAHGSGDGSTESLSQSSKIALGVGIGIGIPILGLLGVIVFLLSISRRNRGTDLQASPPGAAGGSGGGKLGDEHNPTLTGGILTESVSN